MPESPPPGHAGEPPGPGDDDPRIRASNARYWRTNVRIMATLLAIWAIAGPGCGVLFADWLNTFRLGGFPVGFWFAQQGSIAIFVLLILAYALLLNRLDRKHRDELGAIRRSGAQPGDATGNRA